MSAVLVLGKSVIDQLLTHDSDLARGFDTDADLAMSLCGTEINSWPVKQLYCCC